MKHCDFCDKDKPLSEFTMRKRPPIQPYKYCRDCESVAYSKPTGKNSYVSEMRELKAKAVKNRKFTPEQDIEIYKRVESGEYRNHIAKEKGVSDHAIGSAYKRGRKFAART